MIDKTELNNLYKNKSTVEIAKLLCCSDETVRKYLKRYNIPLRSRGDGVRLWAKKKKKVESLYIDKDGYCWIRKSSHPFCNSQGRIAYHRYLVEKHIGRYLTKSEVIHHVDGNPQNNNIDNLKIYSISEHLAWHRKALPHTRDGRGQFCD